jgi:hypothetical protein
VASQQAECEFDLSATDLWDLIGDFGDMEKWSGKSSGSCVAEGEGIGALRTITMRNGGEIVDRLDALGEFTYSYSIVTSPLPLKTYRATMTVEPLGDAKSKLTWSGEFEPAGISDEEARALVAGMYNYGIGLMNETVARLAND